MPEYKSNISHEQFLAWMSWCLVIPSPPHHPLKRSFFPAWSARCISTSAADLGVWHIESRDYLPTVAKEEDNIWKTHGSLDMYKSTSTVSGHTGCVNGNFLRIISEKPLIRRVSLCFAKRFIIPLCSMDGIFTYIYPQLKPNVGKCFHTLEHLGIISYLPIYKVLAFFGLVSAFLERKLTDSEGLEIWL